jgi:segregation and condensation protein A
VASGGQTGTETPPEPPTGYHVRLDVFEGPFDLLLRLIAVRKLDISEVDLAEITADFVAHLHLDDPDHPEGIGALDLETATHFLVVAATLIELKAARLLPADHRDELDDLLADAHDVLYARLLEYRAFREASEQLAELVEANAGFVPREVALEPRFQGLAPDAELDVEPTVLAGIAAAALAPRPEPHVDIGHIHRELLTVREASGRILARLGHPGDRTTYRALVAGLSRSERVVHFLAILELYKLGHVDLHQPDLRGALAIRRRAGGRELTGLTLVDEAEGPSPEMEG